MAETRRAFKIKKYWNRFRYLFFDFYHADFVRYNTNDIRNSILISVVLIVSASLFQIIFLDLSIYDDAIRKRVLLIRGSFIGIPILLYFFLRKTASAIAYKFGNYLTGLISFLLFLHIPLIYFNPSNHSFYLLNSGVIFLGSCVILWMEPIRVGYILLGYVSLLVPLSVKIYSDQGMSPQTIIQNISNALLIVFIAFIANTMINYWRFEDYRTNRRLKRTLKNLKSINHKIREISNQDSLTDLYNRRFLIDTFEKKVKEINNGDFTFGLVILDLDHLKAINDKYGHIQGDRVILKFSEIVRENTSKQDIIARIGGDEFCILTHRIHKLALENLIEKVRSEISNIQMPVYNNPIHTHGITASIGAILVDEKLPKSFDVLYHKIDEALYQAKLEGRNKAIMVHF